MADNQEGPQAPNQLRDVWGRLSQNYKNLATQMALIPDFDKEVRTLLGELRVRVDALEGAPALLEQRQERFEGKQKCLEGKQDDLELKQKRLGEKQARLKQKQVELEQRLGDGDKEQAALWGEFRSEIERR